MNPARYRLGVDVGGTHTDLVLLDTTTGELLVEKVASTPKNPALGVLDGLAKFIARGVAPAETARGAVDRPPVQKLESFGRKVDCGPAFRPLRVARRRKDWPSTAPCCRG